MRWNFWEFGLNWISSILHNHKISQNFFCNAIQSSLVFNLLKEDILSFIAGCFIAKRTNSTANTLQEFPNFNKAKLFQVDHKPIVNKKKLELEKKLSLLKLYQF